MVLALACARESLILYACGRLLVASLFKEPVGLLMVERDLGALLHCRMSCCRCAGGPPRSACHDRWGKGNGPEGVVNGVVGSQSWAKLSRIAT